MGLAHTIGSFIAIDVSLLSVLGVAGLRVDDVGKASAVIADMRKIIRQDPRIIQKLHRRVFFDKLTREQVGTCCCLLCLQRAVQLMRLGTGYVCCSLLQHRAHMVL